MIERLRADVLARYASIHAFCRDNPQLKRSIVYLVLGGRYPGNVGVQASKIRAALEKADQPSSCAENQSNGRQPAISRDEVGLVLQEVRCGHCRKLDRRGCPDCRRQTEKEAKELYQRLYPAK